MCFSVSNSDQRKENLRVCLHNNHPECCTVKHLSFTSLFKSFFIKCKKKKNVFLFQAPSWFYPCRFPFLTVLLIAWNISPSVPEAVVYVSPLSTVCLPGRAPPCWAAARPPSWSICRGGEQVLTWRSALMLFSCWAATQGAELSQHFSSHKTLLHYQINKVDVMFRSLVSDWRRLVYACVTISSEKSVVHLFAGD